MGLGYTQQKARLWWGASGAEDWLAGLCPAAHPPRMAWHRRPVTAPSHRQVRVESNVADVHRSHARGLPRALLRQNGGSKYDHTPAKSGRRRRARATGGNRRCSDHTAGRGSLRLCTTFSSHACGDRMATFSTPTTSLDCGPVGRAGGLRGWGRSVIAMYACGTPADCRRMCECR